MLVEVQLVVGLFECTDLERRILIDYGHSCIADVHVAVTLEKTSAADCVTAMLIISEKEHLSPRSVGAAAMQRKGSFPI